MLFLDFKEQGQTHTTNFKAWLLSAAVSHGCAVIREPDRGKLSLNPYPSQTVLCGPSSCPPHCIIVQRCDEICFFSTKWWPTKLFPDDVTGFSSHTPFNTEQQVSTSKGCQWQNFIKRTCWITFAVWWCKCDDCPKKNYCIKAAHKNLSLYVLYDAVIVYTKNVLR